MSSPLNPPSKPNRPKRVTLRDIAKVAGVHVMTVSEAINDTGSVAPATRARIKQIAKELNYVPNFAARALATGRTGIIAVLSGAMNEPYYANMVHGLEKPMIADGFRLMLLRTHQEVRNMINASGNSAVDGAIAIDMYHLVDEFRSHSEVPCVSIGSSPRDFVDNVMVDLGPGVTQAVEMMIAAGRKRIAYLVTQPRMALPTEVRASAYYGCMERAGQTPEVIDVKTNIFSDVRTRLKAHLEANGCPDGLFCQNDETAMIAYRVIRELGYRVPEDVMMVGCDGQSHMDYFDTPLSTIRQPMEEMCALAWKFLRARMEDHALPVQRGALQGELIVRKSLVE